MTKERKDDLDDASYDWDDLKKTWEQKNFCWSSWFLTVLVIILASPDILLAIPIVFKEVIL